MSLPNNHPLNERTISCFTTSVGGTPIAAHVPAPFRGKLIKVESILGGAITSADATIAVAIGGNAVTGGAITITQSGSAVGDYDSAIPSGANEVNEGDVVSFTPSSASGANIPCHFFATFRAG